MKHDCEEFEKQVDGLLKTIERKNEQLRKLRKDHLFAMRYVRKMSQTICSSDKVTEKMAEEAREFLSKTCRVKPAS